MKKISVLATIFLIAGCFGGYSEQSNFYNLQAMPKTDEVVSMKRINIGLDDAELPDYLDKPQMIVKEQNSPQVGISENNRWGEPLSTMIQHVVAQNIANYMPSATVKARSSLVENFNYIVDVQISKMDFVWEDKAVLKAWWYISDNAGIVRERQEFRSEVKVEGGFEKYVIAQSKLINDMSKEIAKALAKR